MEDENQENQENLINQENQENLNQENPVNQENLVNQENQINQGNNNERRFNNPFNLDPKNEDICIDKRINRDIFCPLFYFFAEFGILNQHYSIILFEPLKESFFHFLQAIFFPNASPLQISLIFCYIITITYIITLCFGLDETNINELLQVKLSTLDIIGTFYPKKIRNNPLEFYRLLICPFLHLNFGHYFYCIINLLIYCTFFEVVVKKHIFLLIFFLIGIFSNITIMASFKDEQRSFGMNYNISGIIGAFFMLLIMNWKETSYIYGYVWRINFFTVLSIYYLCNTIVALLNNFIIFKLSLINFGFGFLFLAIICKPIKPKIWKNIVRIISGIIVLTLSCVSLISFYSKEKN